MKSRKAIFVTVVFVCLGLGYLWLYQSRKVPPLEVTFMQMRGSSPVFSFNDSVVVNEVKVTEADAEDGDVESDEHDQAAAVLWHLKLRPEVDPQSTEDRRTTRAVSYGRGIRNLRPVEGTPRRGGPLRIGGRYRFEAMTRDDGPVRLTFEVQDPS